MCKPAGMTSRERVLAAMRRQGVDYVPCAPFMNFQPEDQRWGMRWQFPFGPSIRETLDYMMGELGTDQILQTSIGYFPGPEVSCRVWMDNGIVHKTWTTPAGELHASIKYDEHWVYGLDIPFFNDYNPSHFVEPWIKTMQDVDCLRHILHPPRSADSLARLRFRFEESKRIAERYNIVLGLYEGLGLTGAVHMFGATEICMLSVTEPDLVDAYLDVDHQYNLKIMELALDMGVDMIRRNGFYETCDLFSPALLDKFLFNRLKEEIRLVHQADKLIGYTLLTGVMPLMDYLARLDFDCIFCPDVFYKDMDAAKIKMKLGEHKSFWVGPSDTIHLPYDRPDETRAAVRHVFNTFGKTGLIVTPCSSSKAVFPWSNILAMVDEWKKMR